VETPTTDTGLDTIRALSSSTIQPSPTLHQFSLENLRYIESHMDKGVQATQSLTSTGVQINPTLTIDTGNIKSPLLQDVNIRDLNIETLNKSTQTLFTRLEQGIQTIDSPETKVSAMEMNLEDFILDPVDPLNETIMNN
jgi:hypothetical protein